jgi:lysophospholipase L1-like esterase
MRAPALLGAALFVATLAGACGGGAAPPASPQQSATTAGPAGAASVTPAPLGSAPPTVYILGGSSARESIVGNASLATEIARAGGPAVRVLDLGATNQTYFLDAALVEAMPEGPALVLIGVNPTRYTGSPPASGGGAGAAAARATLAAAGEVRHRYRVAAIRSDAEKTALAARWVAERKPLFEANYAVNAAELERLVRLCRQRGFRPVLIELPIDLRLAGDTFGRARARYRADSRRLAARYDIPFLDFVARAGLRNAEFYDLFHLVEPGRAKWQKRLTAEIVPLLRAYRIGVD